MASIVSRLTDSGHLTPPKFLPKNVHYEALTGSVAYGVSSDTSDMDIVGFCTPPKHVVFPHLAGEIYGFGKQKKRFEQLQQHHIKKDNKNYDITIYNIVKYFSLCMDGNPNMVDSLFVPVNCILSSTMVGQHVRENRHLFLHKGMWHKYKGYAFSQIHKMKIKNPQPGSTREKLVQEFGYDTKFAYHVVRLMGEIEQILATGDMDLQKDREKLKAIRRGEWTEDQIIELFTSKEAELEKLYNTSTKVPYSPRQPEIKQLLMDCLEMCFGDLSTAVVVPTRQSDALLAIQEIASKALS
jgi:predicted nucleotidyltransferase